MRQKPFLLSGLALASGLFVASCFASYTEIISLVGSGSTEKQRFDSLLVRPIPFGFSQQSQRLAINDCVGVLLGVRFFLLPKEEKGRVADNCNATARSITDQVPNQSVAWYVVALSAAALGNWTEMNDALVRGAEANPNQEGYAYFRAVLAFENREHLTDLGRSALSRDILTATFSLRGIDWIAEAYLDNPNERAFLTAAMEAASSETQRRFLRAVSIGGGGS